MPSFAMLDAVHERLDWLGRLVDTSRKWHGGNWALARTVANLNRVFPDQFLRKHLDNIMQDIAACGDVAHLCIGSSAKPCHDFSITCCTISFLRAW